MKNTTKLFLIVLSSYSITVADEFTPSQLVGQVHPKALRAYMETQVDMKEMLTLFDLFWTRTKGGILSKDYEEFCRSINKAFTILFDKYFNDADKWNKAKPFIIAKQNELMPDESIDDLIWVPAGKFDIRLVTEVKEFNYYMIGSKLPHEVLERNLPLSIIRILQKRRDMQELLALYSIYWKYAENKSVEFEEFCLYLKNAFNFLFDRYFSSLQNSCSIFPNKKKKFMMYTYNKMITKPIKKSPIVTRLYC